MSNAECFVEDDGVVVTAVEAAGSQGHRQSLEIRVGPVYYRDGPDGVGVWVSYQEEFLRSPEQGPVLLTPDAWRELSRAVNHHLNRKTRPSVLHLALLHGALHPAFWRALWRRRS